MLRAAMVAMAAAVGVASAVGCAAAEEAATSGEDGWVVLFDGGGVDAWRGYNREDFPGGWRVEDGTLVRAAEAGDIITRRRFGSFDLRFDWSISSGGNSGVLYRVVETEAPAFHSGPEYQIIDDAARGGGGDGRGAAGSNYALHAPVRDVSRPAGEWNTARILVEGDRVEHWLNGVRVVTYEMGSADWKRRVAESKFSQWPIYGTARRGHIALQDHGDMVWYRNIRIRPLD